MESLAAHDGFVSIVVFGGYGVFGSHVCRELARRGSRVTVVGRDRGRAAALAESLGAGHRALAADVGDTGACRDAIAEHAVAVHCAGPFGAASHALLDACLEAGCHYVDIADDREYAAAVRRHSARFRERGLTAAFGCSSLPGLSGALAEIARGARSEAPSRARVALFVGNRNAKSETVILSLVRGLARDIRAPQGVLRGFRDHESIDLPAPFGRRGVYAFESPDYDLLPESLRVSALSVLVGFENRLAGPLFLLLARAGSRWGRRTASVLAHLGRLSQGGSSGGTVVVDLFWPDGLAVRAGLHAAREGQRMAALPAALAAHALESGRATARGALTVAELLGNEALLGEMTAAGFERVG